MIADYIVAAGLGIGFFLCFPLADRIARWLLQKADSDWQVSAVEWSEAAGASRETLSSLRSLGAVTHAEPSAASIWALRVFGCALATVAGFLMIPDQLLFWVPAASLLLVAALVDQRGMILPDALVFLVGALGFAASILGCGLSPITAITGLLAGGFSFWVLAEAYRLIRGRDGLGMGDVKLFAISGVWVDWHFLPFVALSAAILGFLTMIVTSQNRGPVSFGPHLAFSMLLMTALQSL